MAKAKKGDKLSCGVCGLVVSVDEACGCGDAAVVLCCSKPMTKTNWAAKRTKKVVAAKKPAAKARKAPAKAAAKKPAKAAAKAKPAAKKRARAKK